ncbi:MAG TPA: trypsin-like peptidase domain-containing protein [Candidatus Eisenbacteria bacterium]|nr:trypsin-like peptidase domain-containing protein [Candidatus Eisenbacteria bacterium]
MAIDFRTGITRVLSASGTTAGTGFLVANRSEKTLIATCSHVVQGEALQRRGDERPETVQVAFGVNGAVASAAVAWWSPADKADVAILSLDRVPPPEATPLSLGSDVGINGHDFESRGYRLSQQFDAGLETVGKIHGLVTHQGNIVLQIGSSQIDHGMSGAPIWDVRRQRVVGMVNSFWATDSHRDADLAFATPSSVLQDLCPDLQLTDICPYRGLLAFTEADVAFFHGRQELVACLENSLRRRRQFLAVVGSSGSGKSSLVQAGLLPRLRRGDLPGFENSRIVTFRPLAEPRLNLLRAIQATEDDLAGQADPFEAIRHYMERNPNQRVVVFADQFEELFALTSQQQRDDVLRGLSTLLEILSPFTLILTVRADFYDSLLRSPLGSRLDAEQINVRPMTRQELTEAIVEPAEAVGLLVESGLNDLILRDVEGTHNPLPLLESALTELWKHRKEGELKIDYYRTLGGVGGAIAQWADDVYQTLDDAERQQARRILTRLVHYGDADSPDTRRRLLTSEVPGYTVDSVQARVVKALADARLIVTDSDQSGETSIEIIHDALLTEWPKLRQWIQEWRGFLVWRQRLSERLNEWRTRGFDVGNLLRGSALNEASDWLTRRRDDLSSSEVKYVRQGLALRRRENMMRWALLSGGVLAVLATLVGYVVIQQRTIARTERLRAQNLSDFRIGLPVGARLIAIRPLPANNGEQPWGPGQPLKLENFRTGPTSFGLAPGYYVLQYQVGQKTYPFGLYSRGFGYDPSVEVPTPSEDPGYEFIPGGTVPSGDLLGVGDDNEESTAPVTLPPYFIAVDRVSQEQYAAVTGSTAGSPLGFTWNEALGYCRKLGSRLPSLVEWEWAGTLAAIAWQNDPRWEWTSTRHFPPPYDNEDGRDNVFAPDAVRTAVGGGLTSTQFRAFSQSGEMNTDTALTDLQAKYPAIVSADSPDETNPEYLKKHPELEDFLKLHPEERDLNSPDKFKLTRPTRSRPEPINLVHQFRVAKSVVTEAMRPLSPPEIHFAPDRAALDPQNAKMVRQFAENWLASSTKPALMLEGYTDELGSEEYNLGYGQRMADAVAYLLKNEGLPPEKISSMACGKDRPKAQPFVERSFYLFSKDDLVTIVIEGH